MSRETLGNGLGFLILHLLLQTQNSRLTTDSQLIRGPSPVTYPGTSSPTRHVTKGVHGALIHVSVVGPLFVRNLVLEETRESAEGVARGGGHRDDDNTALAVC